tara:strand:+ start:661 stop:765 length:105 start_codon:yes stop_codon:yes gene_type:complete
MASGERGGKESIVFGVAHNKDAISSVLRIDGNSR